MCSVTHSCPTLCDPIFHSLLCSSVLGILHARILELPFPTPGDLPDPGIEPAPLVSLALASGCTTWEAPGYLLLMLIDFSHFRLYVAHQAPLSTGFLGKNTEVDCHYLLQGIFLTQGSNPCFLCLLHCRRFVYH